ncbi:LacI family DNA-binding transcriptional regulator [Streptomyces thermodiastaticus]
MHGHGAQAAPPCSRARSGREAAWRSGGGPGLLLGGALRGRQGTDRLRTRGYQSALRAAHVPFRQDLIVPVEHYHWQDGARAAAALLARQPRPDALLCLNDHLALGALRALHEAGLSAPDDLDVVGFDDIEAARFSVPSLTTIAPDKEAIADVAVSLLLDRIDNPGTKEPSDHIVDHRLTVRESTGGGV